MLPITPHRAETYAYFVRLHDAQHRFEARFAAAPAVYRIQAAVSSGPRVIDGTGDGQAGRGEMIPIQVRLAQPAQVKQVVLFHRSSPASAWTSKPMEMRAQTDAEAIWSETVERPLGPEKELEYHVQAIGTDGAITSYGAANRPHRLRLVPPTLPAEADE